MDQGLFPRTFKGVYRFVPKNGRLLIGPYVSLFHPRELFASLYRRFLRFLRNRKFCVYRFLLFPSRSNGGRSVYLVCSQRGLRVTGLHKFAIRFLQGVQVRTFRPMQVVLWGPWCVFFIFFPNGNAYTRSRHSVQFRVLYDLVRSRSLRRCSLFLFLQDYPMFSFQFLTSGSVAKTQCVHSRGVHDLFKVQVVCHYVLGSNFRVSRSNPISIFFSGVYLVLACVSNVRVSMVPRFIYHVSTFSA